MTENKITAVFRVMNQKPMVYHRIYAQLTGSVTAGLLLSQIVYWWFTVHERTFWKTDKKFCEELCMGSKEFRNAKQKIRALGVVKITRKGHPATTHYEVDIPALLGQISSLAEKDKLDAGPPSLTERVKLDCPKGSNQFDRKGQTNIEAEITTESTQRKDKSSSKLLSSAAAGGEGRQLLQGAGIHPKVATALACEQKHPTESIAAAIENARSRRAWLAITDRFRARLFNIAGYVIRTLNQARREGHLVKRSKRSLGIERMARDRIKYRSRDRPEVEPEQIEEELKEIGKKMKKELALASA